MRINSVLVLASIVVLSACQRESTLVDPERIISMERAALDRWGKGDPGGYLEIMAPEVTYFDPLQAARIDGLPAMRGFLIPLTGRIAVDRFEMLKPSVQRHGDVALLTFNLLSYRKRADGVEPIVARWNSTETYAHQR